MRETTRHREAYAAYLALGAERSIERLHAELAAAGRTPSLRTLCYQKMSSARMSRGETLVLVMQPAQDRPTHDLALAPGR